MKKWIGLVAMGGMLVLAGKLAANHDHSYGLEEASRVCSRLTFDSSKMKCLSAIRGIYYLEVEAVRVCGNLTFDNSTIECLKAIRGKVYMSAEVDICRNMTFDSSTVECFKESGRSDRW